MDVLCHRLAKYIAAISALMDGRLNAVIFTGGSGENSSKVRELALSKLGLLGFDIDHERNISARFGKSGTGYPDQRRTGHHAGRFSSDHVMRSSPVSPGGQGYFSLMLTVKRTVLCHV